MELILDFFNGGDIVSTFLKLFGIVLGFLYLFFAWIMMGQVKALKRSLTINDDGLLVSLAYVQIILAAVILLFALFIL